MVKNLIKKKCTRVETRHCLVSTWAKSNILSKILLLFFLVWPTMISAEEQVWLKDFDVALKKAQEEKKPILVFVTAKWCSFCTMMHNTTLPNKEVMVVIDKFIRVEIDFDQNPDLCATWGAGSLPTTLLFNQFGESVAKVSGFKAPEDFIDWLLKNQKSSLSNESIKETSQHTFQMMFELFKAADQSEKNTIFANILDAYYQQKDKETKEFITLKLIEIIQFNPSYAEPLLCHSRLEARILAAVILEKLKSNFIFDPWETAETRQEQIKYIIPQLPTLKTKAIIKQENKK